MAHSSDPGTEVCQQGFGDVKKLPGDGLRESPEWCLCKEDYGAAHWGGAGGSSLRSNTLKYVSLGKSGKLKGSQVVPNTPV